MTKTKTSRRRFLQGSVGIMGLAAVPLTLSQRQDETLSVAERAQIAHIEAVLHKQAGRSRQLRIEHIRVFARRFTEEYGVVDYRQRYSGLVGEYHLTRLFVRSVQLSA